MKKPMIIGVTGGVGAGKTKVLTYIKENYNAKILIADEIANNLKKPGEKCYNSLIHLLGHDIIATDGQIDNAKMAALVFANTQLLARVNELLHPAVKEKILEIICEERCLQQYDFVLIEAALLIDAGFTDLLDQLWYIHSDPMVRKERLFVGRGYSESKTLQIMNHQLKEEQFREACDVVIDNSKELSDTYLQINEKLGDYLCKME